MSITVVFYFYPPSISLDVVNFLVHIFCLETKHFSLFFFIPFELEIGLWIQWITEVIGQLRVKSIGPKNFVSFTINFESTGNTFPALKLNYLITYFFKLRTFLPFSKGEEILVLFKVF